LIAEVSKELPSLTLVECGVVGIYDLAEASSNMSPRDWSVSSQQPFPSADMSGR
jgi:hypothetical protein